VRSASPLAGTTERAGIAEASPAGERSGYDAVPGSAQDGETPTVDQSREGPFRDTAPRQDPAASRLDLIWGSDPPDEVRWHMDMTTDQETPTSGSPDSDVDEPGTEERGGDHSAAASPSTDGDATATGAGPRALSPFNRHGGATQAEDLGDQEVPVVPHPSGTEGGSGDDAGGPGPSGAEAGTSEGAADSGSSGAEPGSGENVGAADPSQTEMGSGEGAGALDPGVARMGSGVDAGAADPNSVGIRAGEPASGDPAQLDPSGQQAASDVGWFSTVAGRGQYTGALSERLSAERPGDTPPYRAMEGVPSGSAAPTGSQAAVPELDAPPGPQGPSSGERSGGAAAGPTATEPGAGAEPPAGNAGSANETRSAFRAAHAEESSSVDGPTGVGDPRDAEAPGAEASSGRDRSDEPGGLPTSDAIHAGTGPAPVAHELHGPELVDPDPEIGSPPRPAGWSSQPAARQDPSEGFGDRSDADTRSDETSLERARAGAAASSPDPDLGATGSGPGVALRAEPDGRESGQGTAGGPGSDPDAAPWNEPALPMAFPAGRGSSNLGERGEPRNQENLDDELVAKPDPTWPRLFGSNAEAQAASDTDGVSTFLDQPAAPMYETAGEWSVEEPGQDPWLERQEDLSASEPHSPSVGLRPGLVDGTTGEPRMGGEPIPQPGHQQSAVVDSASVADIDSNGGSATSTVTQQAEAEELDLRDTPPSPHSVDVSRETSAGGGEGMKPGLEDEAVEDEAAIAVREAASRAAAEAGGDVSRETSPLPPGTPIDELIEEPTIDRDAAARSARVTFRIHRDTLSGDRRVLAVANQKGGVGKSTTAVNIGAYLALAGARVLVVDLDPQGNASTGLGLDHRELEPSIYDVLTGDAPPATAIRATGVADLHILPSTIDLAGAEVELVSAMSRETRLRRALESIDHQYDTILIDCPPSLGLLTVNALAAADELLIPIQCEYYALEGLGQLLRNVELVRANLNPELRIGGIVLTMYDGRTRLALQVVDEVRKHFTDVVYQTVVPRSVRLSEAPGYGLPIALYDPLSRGGIAYRDLTLELAERSGLLAPTGEGAS
jgi:chromosome partitioning protein